MKTQLLLVALLALAGTAVFVMNSSESTQNNLRTRKHYLHDTYVQWKSEYGQNSNGSEDSLRFAIFVENFEFAKNYNAKQTGSMRLGMNKFAAMNNEEFASIFTAKMTGPKAATQQIQRPSGASVPETVDWVKAGAVAPVEDQGQCGSCWAFSTKGGLEGTYQIASEKLVVLSAQQLVDCSGFPNMGCSGGDPMAAYSYASKNGIQSEESYPYVSGNTKHKQDCDFNSSDVVYTPTGQVKVSPTNNVDAIQEAAAERPLTIEVSAGNIPFQLYTSGVLNNPSCPTALDHGILLVGYSNAGSEPFWRIKNSWGTGWGEQGYASLAITGDGPGMCGVQQYSAYPLYKQ